MNQKVARPLKTLLRHALHGLGKLLPGAPPRVLMYHSIDDFGSPISVSPAQFAAQMDHLVAAGYTTWTASRFVDAVRDGQKFPKKLAVLTFDDGYLNNVTHALPILEQRGLCATVFMVTDNDGAAPQWGERDLDRIRTQIDEDFPGSADEKREIEASVMATMTEKIATWDELQGAPSRGLEVLSHTRTHAYLDAASDDELKDELVTSREELERRGFGASNSLAWPYGKYNEKAMKAAEAAGYRGAFLAGYYRELRHFADPWRIHRVGVDGSRGMSGFRFVLGRGYDLLAWLKALRGDRKPA